MTETVWLQRPNADVPWGFRLQGGRDYQTPLNVQKVTPGSVAASGLSQGDVILRIGDADTFSLTYAQAMDIIKGCGNLLQLNVSKGGGGPQPAQVETSDSSSNMASDGLHDLFSDMYRYGDSPYGRQGTQSQPPSSYPSYSSPSYSGRGQDYGSGVHASHGSQGFDQYGRQGSRDQYYGGPGSGLPMHTPAPPTYTPAPPTYNDVQIHRDQVAYPYHQSAPSYPYQPSQPQYPYPTSVSSSTSELSDISSGIGTSESKTGASPAMGRSVTSPSTGGYLKPYTSGSSMDSSGVGSYNCETPDFGDTTYISTRPEVVRQDSFPLPPPPPEASYSSSVIGHPEPPVADPYKAAAPSAPAPPPPPPPPPPPLPSQCPPKSWKAKQTEDNNKQQPTRLEQQLSNMSLGSDYGRQNSYPYQAPQPQSPSHPPGAPAPYGQTYSPSSPASYSPASPSQYAPTSPSQPPQPKPQPAMPDAVLNMAARGDPDKKPFAYAPDMDIIKEQRDKVRRRAPCGGMPKYQQLLNLPNFEDPPKPRGHGLAPQTPTSPPAPDYMPGPGDAEVAHLQYNSPLQMYSEQNVADAFMGQTDGVVTGVAGLKKDDGSDITRSPVYRMIHGMDENNRRPRPVTNVPTPEGKNSIPNGGTVNQQSPKSSTHVQSHRTPPPKHGVSFRVLQWLTDTEDENEAGPTQEGQRVPKSPAVDDELCFSGVNNRADIPSKSFHRLQNMTGSSEVDTSSIRANVTGDENIGGYDQASIRYTGRNIPSKSFRMLQSMTGADPIPEESAPRQTRRQRPRPAPEPQSPEQNPDDIVDISYVGGNIPSRSFQMLQHIVGEPQSDHDKDTGVENGDAAYDDMYYMGKGIPSRSFQLLQGAYGTDDMDKHALATERRRRRRDDALRQSGQAEDDMSRDDFDEDAYLTGQIPLNVSGTGEKPKPSLREPTDTPQAAPWQSAAEKQKTQEDAPEEGYFDEDAYLSGQISILGNKPTQPIKSHKKPETFTYEPEEDTPQRDFDEDAYLAGRLPLWDGDTSHAPRVIEKKKTEEEEPEWVKLRQQKAKKLPEIDDANNNEQFDEDRFLGRQHLDDYRQDMNDGNQGVVTGPFDEEAYLSGSANYKDPPQDSSTEAAVPWKKETDVDVHDSAFDEEAYLRGGVPILRQSVDKELPPRDAQKAKVYHERAPWERDDDQSQQDFDEQKYLLGRVPTTVRTSVEREIPTSPNAKPQNDQFAAIPSRTFHYLRRSVSREASPPHSSSGRSPSRSSREEEEESDPNKAYNEMMYVGNKIPSKTFLRLKQSVASRESCDPIDHLMENMEEDINMDNLQIDSHDPDQYMAKLKETVQTNNNIKIEAIPNEVTDF